MRKNQLKQESVPAGRVSPAFPIPDRDPHPDRDPTGHRDPPEKDPLDPPSQPGSQTGHPLDQTPPLRIRHPSGSRHPPPKADASIQSMSGWYASYWNAFLFIISIVKTLMTNRVFHNSCLCSPYENVTSALAAIYIWASKETKKLLYKEINLNYGTRDPWWLKERSSITSASTMEFSTRHLVPCNHVNLSGCGWLKPDQVSLI